MATDDLRDRAEAWLADDPDPVSRDEIRALLDGLPGTVPELRDRFAGPLTFGTAGLRGRLRAGPNGMNLAVVTRAAAGLVGWLAGQGGEGPLVIGYDARHGSREFARRTAEVATGAGREALLLPRPLPTPVLAFAVRHLGTDAGVMVTASHNPPQDNGYKVYLGGAEGGSQIVPPADAEIAARIAAVGALAGVPRPQEGWEVLGEEVLQAYLAEAAAAATPAPADDRRARLRVVLTPMHGVGGAVVVEALRRAGVEGVTVVPEQAEPDPDFPTVAFPNPEEPGAIDLALALARERGADLVIAVDPDADRCAVAVDDPAGPAGAGWRMLTGDELGALLGEVVAATTPPGPERVLANSLVSSRVLGRIAAAHGLGHAETLTGFKWISRAPGLVYGYEEAIGYCVRPSAVRDKDGVSAAVLVATVAADLAARGRSLLDVLDDLARAHGVHATDQLSVRVTDLSLIGAAMARLRATPPTALGGSAVVSADDLREGAGGLPPTDGLRYLTADGARVVVRPSGTEPKLKCYLEVVRAVGPDGDLGAARAAARASLAALRADVAAALGI